MPQPRTGSADETTWASLPALLRAPYAQLIEQQRRFTRPIGLLSGESLLELLRQIVNYESNDQKFLQVVLFAQEEFRASLHRARNLENRIVMSSTLESLSLADTQQMLRFRWEVAGGEEFPFTDDAVQAIYAATQGVPRSQIILADNALLVATLHKADNIGPDIIEQVVRDRGLADMVATQPAGREAA